MRFVIVFRSLQRHQIIEHKAQSKAGIAFSKKYFEKEDFPEPFHPAIIASFGSEIE